MSTDSFLTEILEGLFLQTIIEEKIWLPPNPRLPSDPTGPAIWDPTPAEDVRSLSHLVWTMVKTTWSGILQKTATGRYHYPSMLRNIQGKGTFHLHVYQKTRSTPAYFATLLVEFQSCSTGHQPDNYLVPSANVPGQRASSLVTKL